MGWPKWKRGHSSGGENERIQRGGKGDMDTVYNDSSILYRAK